MMMAYDTATKLIVSNGNVDDSSDDDGNGNCRGNGYNAPNDSITIVMVSMKAIVWGTEVCCVLYMKLVLANFPDVLF